MGTPQMQYFLCRVNGATTSTIPGPGAPANPVYIFLSDSGNMFGPGWFFASDAIKREMLSIALTAISTQSTVIALVDPDVLKIDPRQPQPVECYELTISVDMGLGDYPPNF